MAQGINLTSTAAALKTGTISDPSHMESLRAQAAEAMPVSPNFPALATSPGTAGMLAYDATHVYICIAANTWVRAVTATF
jgi:hypothetical protein